MTPTIEPIHPGPDRRGGHHSHHIRTIKRHEIRHIGDVPSGCTPSCTPPEPFREPFNPPWRLT